MFPTGKPGSIMGSINIFDINPSGLLLSSSPAPPVDIKSALLSKGNSECTLSEGEELKQLFDAAKKAQKTFSEFCAAHILSEQVKEPYLHIKVCDPNQIEVSKSVIRNALNPENSSVNHRPVQVETSYLLEEKGDSIPIIHLSFPKRKPSSPPRISHSTVHSPPSQSTVHSPLNQSTVHSRPEEKFDWSALEAYLQTSEGQVSIPNMNHSDTSIKTPQNDKKDSK